MAIEHHIDPATALALWNAQKSLREIRNLIAPAASKTAVARAIRQAVKAGGEARAYKGQDPLTRARRLKIPERIEKLKAQIAELEAEYVASAH